MAKKLSILDRSFWLTETKQNPKHVASLQFLTKPDNAPDDYCAKLVEEVKKHDKAFYPFNSRVISFMRIAIGFKEVEKLDMDYHIQFHQVPEISDRAALHSYAAKLHEPMLDRDKPLWQMHIIEGNMDNQFAIFFTIHHTYGDGASLVRWFQESYQAALMKTLLRAGRCQELQENAAKRTR